MQNLFLLLSKEVNVYYFKISGQLIKASEIEFISNIGEFSKPDVKAYYFSLKLKNGKIFNYYKEYNESNQLLHHLEVVQLHQEITNTMKTNSKMDKEQVHHGEEKNDFSQKHNFSLCFFNESLLISKFEYYY
jgi:hypothetical protein